MYVQLLVSYFLVIFVLTGPGAGVMVGHVVLTWQMEKLCAFLAERNELSAAKNKKQRSYRFSTWIQARENSGHDNRYDNQGA